MPAPALPFRVKSLSVRDNERRGFFTITTQVEKAHLAAWIERSGYSQAEIARRLGCAESTVGHWTSGKTWPTQYEQQLADLLGTTRAGLRQEPDRYDAEKAFIEVLVGHPRLIPTITRATPAEIEIAIDMLDTLRGQRTKA